MLFMKTMRTCLWLLPPPNWGVFLYRLSTSRVEKSGADSLCGVVWTGLFSGMTASRLGFYPVG
ncbi:hypothetical protein FE381_10315 [Corynebacterium diphtheriae]|nr:hypothetical protein FE381_10315 [Corynebacterium diphtheriae]UJL56812.1 hypothetical protein FE379_10305 [Corynebacterium diphtheriae]